MCDIITGVSVRGLWILRGGSGWSGGVTVQLQPGSAASVPAALSLKVAAGKRRFRPNIKELNESQQSALMQQMFVDINSNFWIEFWPVFYFLLIFESVHQRSVGQQTREESSTAININFNSTRINIRQIIVWSDQAVDEDHLHAASTLPANF